MLYLVAELELTSGRHTYMAVIPWADGTLVSITLLTMMFIGRRGLVVYQVLCASALYIARFRSILSGFFSCARFGSLRRTANGGMFRCLGIDIGVQHGMGIEVKAFASELVYGGHRGRF